jgi:hypothetical protein
MINSVPVERISWGTVNEIFENIQFFRITEYVASNEAL